MNPTKESVACMFDDRTLRFFHVVKKGSNVVVKNFFSEHIPGQYITDQETIIPNPVIIKKLESLRKKNGFKKIHLVIPDRYVTVFHTVMPLSETIHHNHSLQKNIEQYLKKLISQHPHFSVSDIVSDYEIIQETADGYHIHVSVARPDQFKFFPELMESAGFVVDHIDITSFAIHRVAQHMNHGSLYGTIAIGNHDTQINIIRSGKVIASSWVKTGSEQLLQTLQEKLQISKTEAEKIITHYGVLQTHPDVSVLTALREVLAPIISGLRTAIDSCSPKMYDHSFYHGVPTQWYLYGVGSSIPGITQYIGLKSESTIVPIDIIPTELMDDEIIVQIPIKELPLYLPVMSTALAYVLE